jgi:hypothetical protein
MTEQKWKTLDTQKTLDQKRKQEATTSAGVGGFVGPAFKVPLFRPATVEPSRKKKKDRG